MPNHVTNILQFNCSKEKFIEIAESIRKDDSFLGSVDFNKVLPMPPELDIEAGSRGEQGLKLYKEFLKWKEEQHLTGSQEEVLRDYIQRMEIDPETIELGKQYLDNLLNHGAATWYDWCVANWGTKWNACEVQVSDYTIEFSTAWAFAEPVMRKLAELCAKHSVDFEGEWADEDMGSNTGCFDTMGDEKFYCSYYDDCSHNAYAAYVRCNGESDCLGVDEDGNYYRYECGESCPNYEECMG